MTVKLPKLVLALTTSHNAWIVGSAADINNENPRDYDVIVSYSEWQKACMLIPMDAKPNHFGGWKCISEGVEVDVWCGDLSWLMTTFKTKYLWHPNTNVRWIKN